MRPRTLFSCCAALIILVGTLAAQAPKPAPPRTTPPAQAAPAPARNAAPTQSAAPAPATTAPAANVAPTAPVLTLEGFCAEPKAGAAECKTVITRAEFDRLASALQPDMAPQQRANLADVYSKVLVLSSQAAKRGLEKDPESAEILRYQHMSTLAQILLRELQREAQNIPAPELEAYYKEHAKDFEEATLRRL